MPLYEYRCEVCDEVFEQRRSAHDADDARCPNGHAEVRRLLSVFAGGGRAAPAAAAAVGGCCGGGCGCR